MWKISCFLALFVLSSFVIDEYKCAPTLKTTTKRRTTTTGPQKVQNLDSLCHLLNYGEFTHSGLQTHALNIAGEPIHKYQTGYKDRVEYVHAVITPQSIQGGGSVTNDLTRKYARSMGKSTDDAGHIIGNQLGGTGQQTYNIFPQSPNINRGKWSQEEKKIRQLVLSTGQPIDLVVQLYYPSPNATRPDHFIYLTAYSSGCHSATVINP